jgi:hypothetical protein
MRQGFTAAVLSLTLTAALAGVAFADDKDSDSKMAQTTTSGDSTTPAGDSAQPEAATASDNKSTKSSGTKRSGFHMPVLRKTTAPPANPAVPATIDTVPGGSSSSSTPAAKSKPVAGGPQANLGSRMASTVVGAVVGVPILIARRVKPEVITATKELVDNSSKWYYLAPATILGVPGGLISASFQGVMIAPYHAWHYSNDPFSPETFSLGDAK